MKNGKYEAEITINSCLIENDSTVHLANRTMSSKTAAFIFSFNENTSELEAYGGGEVSPNIIANIFDAIAGMCGDEILLDGAMAYFGKRALEIS